MHPGANGKVFFLIPASEWFPVQPLTLAHLFPSQDWKINTESSSRLERRGLRPRERCVPCWARAKPPARFVAA